MAFDSGDREKLQYVNLLFGEDKLHFYYSLYIYFFFPNYITAEIVAEYASKAE